MENQIYRNLGEVIRDEMLMRDKITAFLGDESRTVPEIADALGYPRHEVLIWVMAMWKYGILEETAKPDDEGYYRYKLNH